MCVVQEVSAEDFAVLPVLRAERPCLVCCNETGENATAAAEIPRHVATFWQSVWVHALALQPIA
jgi:hypothetical protein